MTNDELPIDVILPDALERLAGGARRLVLEAPPGAGKTTRFPRALLDQSWCAGRVLVSEPRRIAARLSAARVAEEMGVPVGSRVGYRVRFDERASAETRLVYMTEGLLLKTLLKNPTLHGISALVFDEVHERSAQLDLLLALSLHAQRTNSEVRLIAMSATLNAEVFADYLGGAPVLSSQGRVFPVEVRHAKKEETRALPVAVRSALHSDLRKSGDVLVFLPGEREIRDCELALAAVSDIEVLPLHGSLPIEQQARVLRPGASSGRRVILSTNVAESSLTVPGVTSVIDTGLARVGVFDPWSGISRLDTIEASQARAIQRAGRAGRLAPGEAVRLYTQGSFNARPKEDAPEIQRTDLSVLYLQLALIQKRSGLRPEELRFLCAPDPAKWQKAKELLVMLGALDQHGLTPLGELMAELPLSPRLARVAVHAFQAGIGRQGALATALLAERDIAHSTQRLGRKMQDVASGDSDLLDRMERFQAVEQQRFSRSALTEFEVDGRRAQEVARVARANYASLRSMWREPEPSSEKDNDELLLRSLLSGFSDRVASRKGQGRALLLCDGVQATLSELSCVHHANLLLALSADAPSGRTSRPVVRVASRLDPDWLLEQQSSLIEAVETLEYNAEKQRVEVVSQLRYKKLVLDDSRSAAAPSVEAGSLLYTAALAKGPAVFDPEQRVEGQAARLAMLSESAPEWISSLDAEERKLMMEARDDPGSLTRTALYRACQTRTSLNSLQDADLSQELAAGFSEKLAHALREHAPRDIALRSGRRLKVHYQSGKRPYIQSRLQDFFSMTETPTICFGRLALQIHLLAPNQRPLQVTTDLSGFWTKHYPELRRQLMRRYPKHPWPEDGATATPPAQPPARQRPSR